MRDIPTSPRILEIKRNRRIHRLRLSIIIFIFFIIIVGSLAYFSGNKKVTINKIVVNGTHVIDQEKIQKEVLKDISGKYFYLFTRSNGFIYPHRKIYNNLILNFPRIEKLSVSLEGLNTIKVDVTERTGSYLYCGVVIPEIKNDIGENCYFINDKGLIFDKAPYFSGDVYFKYYLKLADDINDPLGKQMIETNHFYLISRFIDGVKALGFSPIYVTLEKDGTNTLFLKHDGISNIPKIIFKDNDDFSTLLDNLSLSMKKKEFIDEINSKYNSLLYLDLRFKNKVLYKFQ
jgi:hypothetical protein